MRFQDVVDFHEKFQIQGPRMPEFLELSQLSFRITCLEEELKEFIYAHSKEDLVGCADALADLIWFAMGTAVMMGIPLEEVWAHVKRANMTKELAGDPSRSKRGFALDVIKPEGWIGPEPAIRETLLKAGAVFPKEKK